MPAAVEVNEDDGFPADEYAIISERLLLSDRCVRRGSIRLNRVSPILSAPVPLVLPVADTATEAELDAREPMLLASKVRFRCGSKRLLGLAEDKTLGDATADCGLYGHLLLMGESTITPLWLSDIDSACKA